VRAAIPAVAHLSPAGILNSATPVQSSGATPLAVSNDFRTMLSNFQTANIVLRSPYIVMTPNTAIWLATLRSSTGADAFDMDNGTCFGIPYLTSSACQHSASGGSVIACIESSLINYADGGVMIDVSSEASLTLDDAPVGGITYTSRIT
jgi:hypothetical protein